jgi:Carboxypeptidase regulatory-like domain/TonB-dependent Receptor Plug Domain
MSCPEGTGGSSGVALQGEKDRNMNRAWRDLWTPLALMLALQPLSAFAQSISGIVVNEVSGIPLESAVVQLLDADLTPVTSVLTSALGTFQIEVPTEGKYLVTISADGFMSRLSDELTVLIKESYEVVLPLTPVNSAKVAPEARVLRESQESGTSDIVGRVVQQGTNRPLEGVEITIAEHDQTAITNSRGYFNLPRLPEGLYELRFQRLGFAEQSTLLFAKAGNGYQVDVTLGEQAIPIEGVTVTLTAQRLVRSLAQVQFRMDHNRHLGGIYFSRSELALRGEPPLSAMLRSVVGVRIQKYGSEYVVELRSGQARRCGGNPALFVDGVRVSDRQELLPLDMFPSFDIEVVEIYKGAASLPAEFGGADSQCGAIVIWTRRGA